MSINRKINLESAYAKAYENEKNSDEKLTKLQNKNNQKLFVKKIANKKTRNQFCYSIPIEYAKMLETLANETNKTKSQVLEDILEYIYDQQNN
ncbi:hypothetical protein [Mesomycoplasma neurolyticum]|uniref:Uncharacterized protein n=1 Tax=Mesomycoplasma neurolyticum TaxID=2120 RepID=A0A449A4Y1_9BACT|nr:hypothetical protein [Mesomycoplasma neurolyticum]VEU59321.1 Uncharacterised protein [Mesomycoplasma neurolyticum]